MTRDFYREFPGLLSQRFVRGIDQGQRCTREDFFAPPRVWKTVGDEILFCCRIDNLNHLARCIDSFLHALRDFGNTLDGLGKFLDVKGAGWIAAFPAPNVTVSLGDSLLRADQYNEEFECSAERDPRTVDFLGNGIDCGFRIASCASPDRFSMSVELAWLLAEAAEQELFGRQFEYLGRRPLKGVLFERPYPLVCIDTERSPSRKAVRQYEQPLIGNGEKKPFQIRDFLLHFMRDEKIEIPYLEGISSISDQGLPDSFNKFYKNWLTDAEEIAKQRQNEIEAENTDAVGGTEIPSHVLEAADQEISRIMDD